MNRFADEAYLTNFIDSERHKAISEPLVAISKKEEKMTEKISTTKLIWLHLYPGLLIGGLYILLTPSINNFGYPSIMSLMISALLVIIPFELGYLLYVAKKSGNRSIKSILVNEVIGGKKFIGFIIGGIVLSFLIVGLMQFVDESIKKNVFEFSYKTENVQVDLNLKKGEKYIYT